MAVLSEYQINFIIRSTVSRLGQVPQPTNREIHDAIADRLGIPAGPGRAAMWTYIRQGRELAAAGSAVQHTPPGSPPPVPTTIDRGSTAAPSEYVYRVAIDMFDHDTITTTSWLVEVRSRTPLSALEATDRAVGMIMSDPTRDGRYEGRTAVSDPSSYSGRVVTAGVR